MQLQIIRKRGAALRPGTGPAPSVEEFAGARPVPVPQPRRG
jgi:hypothetical protein